MSSSARPERSPNTDQFGNDIIDPNPFWTSEITLQVTQPLLLLRSPQDHVVPPADSARVLSRISSTDVTEILLEQSYHVATLDHDADRIFEESFTFIGRLAPSAGKEGTATGG